MGCLKAARYGPVTARYGIAIKIATNLVLGPDHQREYVIS